VWRRANVARTAVVALGTLVLLSAAPASLRAPPTVVLLVRHAEKEPGAGDVSLSAAGRARAEALATLGRAAGVQAVVTTPYARSRETATPVARALNLTPEIVRVDDAVAEHARVVSDLIRQQHAGRTVLVVGHSNTIPPIVAALGGPRYSDLCDTEYDALFIVVVGDEGPVRTVRSRFGTPTPVGSECAAMR
jgi:broad specificity phosphatase PhoE